VEAPLPPHIYAISLLVDAYIITALVPGLATEELQIEIQDDILRLREEARAEEDKDKEGQCLLREIYHGEIDRRIRLSEPVAASQSDARIEDGILRIRIPKAEEAHPKKIKGKAL
jgi:HSP20 family protein